MPLPIAVLHTAVLQWIRVISPQIVPLGRYAIKWAPYYFSKFVILRAAKKYGTFRLYRRAVEMSRRVAPNEQRARELSGAIKACIRAPLQAHAILMKYDAMLWRWIQKMEGTQKTKREPELRLIAASTKLLLLSQGSRPPSSGDSSDSSSGSSSKG